MEKVPPSLSGSERNRGTHMNHIESNAVQQEVRAHIGLVLLCPQVLTSCCSLKLGFLAVKWGDWTRYYQKLLRDLGPVDSAYGLFKVSPFICLHHYCHLNLHFSPPQQQNLLVSQRASTLDIPEFFITARGLLWKWNHTLSYGPFPLTITTDSDSSQLHWV